MNTKLLLAASAAVALALCACTTTNTSADSTMNTFADSAPFDCTSNVCEVTVGYNMPGAIVARDIQINAEPATVVQITFVVSSWMGAHFPPDGITAANFQCALVSGSTTRILCKGSGFRRGNTYKYGVRLHAGIITPWPLDPFIRN